MNVIAIIRYSSTTAIINLNIINMINIDSKKNMINYPYF